MAKPVVTVWTADVNGHPVKFWVESDHSLTEAEMRERVQAAKATEDAARASKSARTVQQRQAVDSREGGSEESRELMRCLAHLRALVVAAADRVVDARPFDVARAHVRMIASDLIGGRYWTGDRI